MTTVMLETMSTMVLVMPSGMFSRPCGQLPGVGADAQQDVGGKQRAEQHDFGSQKEPDADFGVEQAGVRAGF